MGKLLCLELYNFKSYKGHHVLQFGDSYFTSIIGPNGSGKSNSMDAISFVLGIKSSHLRSAHLKDLVYRGRVLKHSKINADGTATDGVNGDANGDADGDENTPAASQRNDPQTAWVMAVYEDDAGEEQRWKRSITSAGQSEYRINNKIVTAKQYNEALEEENILIKARNFLVFQGDVEAIASQNARDLTRLIEQISGSLDYKSEYERLKVEKERADETQADKLNSRRGINGEIKAYREQKDELDRYESKRDEKDAAIVTHVLWKLFHFQRTIEESTAEMQKHNAELAEYRRGVQKYEVNLEEAKRHQAKVSREVNKSEGDIKRKEKAVEEKRHELVPVEEKLSVSKANVEKRQKHIDTIAGERDKNQASADNFKKQLATVQKAQKRWEDEWRVQQQQTGRELSEEDLAEYQSLRDEITKQAGNEQTKIDQTSRQLKTDEETVKSLKSTLETTQTEVADLESTLAQLNEQRIETNSIIKATTKEINTRKNTINGLTSEKERTTQKRRELEEKHVAVLHKLRDAKATQRESRKEAEQKEMVAELKRIYPGVRGMVHQLCKPKQKKYETAIVTALGRHWDAIITDTEKTAKDCISYIRDKKFGRMSFIPLDNIVHTQPNSNLRGIHQGTRLAIDAIDFDSPLERAMGFVCGNTLVTDTVNIARHLCYERNVEAKAVALDGTIIHRGGNMTGGAEPGGKKRRFEEAEVEKLQELESKFRADIDALPKWSTKRHEELEQLRSELSGLEMNLKYAQEQLQTFEHNIQSTTKKFKHAEKQLAESQRKYDEHAAGVATLREQLEEQSGAVEELEDSTFAAFCQRLGYANIREYEKQQGVLQQEAETKKREFTAQISRLEGQVSRETSRLEEIKKRIALIEQASKRDHNQITLSEREKAEIEAALEEMEGEIEELEGQLAERKEENDKRKEKVNEARRELSKRSADVDATSKQITTLQGEVQKASNGRYTTLKSCKLENIELPLAEGSRKLASLPLEDAVLEEEEDEDAMDVDGETRQARVNDFGIEVDFEELEDDLQEDDSDARDSQLSEKIANLQAELEKMQPNMRSAERLQSTNERLQGVEKEFEESRSAAKKATKEFEKVKNKRMDLFNKAFKHISDQIQPVYAELTKTASFPLGGQASLDVEDDNEPYLSGVKYHAMPPLKRFRDMEHLSGGEKTMAALALLFAIHTYAPSPFFVLDEVDAALDNANTSQLAQYVRDHAGPGMQFVVISLKTGLFQNSETLVGIMRDQAVNSSRALTLDLRKYQAV